jgi:tRNA-5-methyluridine54 2-sulfurtransferase
MTAMVCRRCKAQAAIHLRQHRLALCKEHFLEWMVEQTERFILKYRMFSQQERILLAVSGGKDSLSLWDVLWRLGYSVDGMYINLGIAGEEGYSDASEEFARAFTLERGLKLIVKNVAQEHGRSVPAFAARTGWGRDRPCGVCGIIKRHIMNEAALEGNYQVLATAHNLDDEAAFLMQNTLNWQTDFLRRQAPVLEAGRGFTRKVKPFFRFYERETAAYAILRGIPYIEEECPFATGSKQLEYKALLNKMEVEHPGTKLNFIVGFLNARQGGLFMLQPGEGDEGDERHLCPNCGQPTTKEGLCSFCKITQG